MKIFVSGKEKLNPNFFIFVQCQWFTTLFSNTLNFWRQMSVHSFTSTTAWPAAPIHAVPEKSLCRVDRWRSVGGRRPHRTGGEWRPGIRNVLAFHRYQGYPPQLRSDPGSFELRVFFWTENAGSPCPESSGYQNEFSTHNEDFLNHYIHNVNQGVFKKGLYFLRCYEWGEMPCSVCEWITCAWE